MSTTATRYNRVSRAEGLVRQLEGDIVDKALPPGHHLGTKDELKRRYGVAVATINEAVRMLEVRGLVEARPGPGGGVFVANPSARVRLSGLVLGFEWDNARYSDWIVVRGALEPLIWEEAIKQRTSSDVRALHGIVDAMAHDAQNDLPFDYLKHNWQLHRRVASISTNAPLQSIYLTLLDFIENHLADVAEERPFRGNVKVHRALVQALEDRDSGALSRALRRHERDAMPRLE